MKVVSAMTRALATTTATPKTLANAIAFGEQCIHAKLATYKYFVLFWEEGFLT